MSRRRSSASEKGRSQRKRAGRRKLLRVLLASAVAALVLPAAALLGWAMLPGPGTGKRFVFEAGESTGFAEAGGALRERGALRSNRWFQWYLKLVRPSLRLAPGTHVLNDRLSPRQLAQRLSRVPSRPKLKVTVPEGFQHLQLAERLERLEVCGAAAFRGAVQEPAVLTELGIAGPNAEGYLFPATYELYVDSEPRAVLRLLVDETQRRLARLRLQYAAEFAALNQEFGWQEREILIFASVVQKEAGHSEEQKLVASVFYNRLRDPQFRPAKMLQSDPTAEYGCLIGKSGTGSCAQYRGTITPALLRDPENPYNTYKHPGLPPGPISNPGESALIAVLSPAQTDYLYFVAKGGGRHAFSRTFAEHRTAIERAGTKTPE